MNKQYSSFSQNKGLLWHQWFDGIIAEDFLPPVGAVIDLTDKCNLTCTWCNAKGFRSANQLETSHVKAVVDDLAEWGVKSICYAGGGEPTLHPDYANIIEYTAKKGIQVGLSTNGVCLSRDICNTIANYASFIGFSMDSGTRQTWQKLKCSDPNTTYANKAYSQVIAHAKLLCDLARTTKLDTTYKIMLTPENQDEIYSAARLAKGLGFKSFFVRPAAFENIPTVQAEYHYSIKSINEQMEKALAIENEHFKVYGSFMRVDDHFKRKIPFNRCLATPLIGVFCADGYCYLCIDYRERPYGQLCKHLELRKFWNSPEHHKMINDINLERCPRCAFGNYQEQIQAYKEDYMFKWFP